MAEEAQGEAQTRAMVALFPRATENHGKIPFQTPKRGAAQLMEAGGARRWMTR
jgi:hypothetical protein